jgi:CRP/FNR family transcriptional regulator
MNAGIYMTVDIDVIRNCESLTNLPDDVQKNISDQASLATIPAKTQLFDCGNACSSLPLVLTGSIRVFTKSPSGREISLYRVNKDQLCIITLSCLLGSDPYPATGVTDENVTAIVLPRFLFHELIGNQPEFRTMIFHLFATRLTGFMQLIDEISFRKLDQRLANFLLQHGPRINESHQEIADELGSVREVVSRLLKQFEEKNWIRVARKQIEVVDRNALGDYAAGSG